MRFKEAALACLALVACGKSDTSHRESMVSPIDAASPDAYPPTDAAPRRLAARAEIDPSTGSRLKTAFLAFQQIEGERPSLISGSPVTGLAAGKYHLVVHEGRDCGLDASEAGAAWPGSLDFEVPRKGPTIIDLSNLDLTLEGDRSIVGHTLVLHADAKGKPGRVLGCGAIFSRSAMLK